MATLTVPLNDHIELIPSDYPTANAVYITNVDTTLENNYYSTPSAVKNTLAQNTLIKLPKDWIYMCITAKKVSGGNGTVTLYNVSDSGWSFSPLATRIYAHMYFGKISSNLENFNANSSGMVSATGNSDKKFSASNNSETKVEYINIDSSITSDIFKSSADILRPASLGTAFFIKF